MIKINYPNTQIQPQNVNNQVSFHGLTSVFKNRTFFKANSYKTISKIYKQDIIGSLPKDLITLIQSVAKDKQEKELIINDILIEFQQVVKKLQKYTPFWNNEDNPNSLLYIFFGIKDTITKIKNDITLFKVKRTLTKLFAKNNLIPKKSKVNVSYIDDGAFGNVFLLKIPNLSSKVIKIFKNKPLHPWDIAQHGLLPEINAAMFVTKNQGQKFSKSCFAQTYFASVKGNYMLSEHFENYLPSTISNAAFVNTPDVYPGVGHNINITNDRIFDYGAIKDSNSDMDKQTKRFFKYLIKNYIQIKGKLYWYSAPLPKAKEEKMRKFFYDALNTPLKGNKELPKEKKIQAFNKLIKLCPSISNFCDIMSL